MKWDSAKNYTDNDMLRMQQDAIRRVKEMQLKAEKTLQNANSAHGSPQAQQIHNENRNNISDNHGNFDNVNNSHIKNDNLSGGNISGNGNNNGNNRIVGDNNGTNHNGGNSGNSNTHNGGNNSNNHVGGGGNSQNPSSVSKTIDNILDSGSNLVSNVLSYFTGTQSEQAEDGELSPIASILKTLHLDSERLIVLGLLVVLMNEKADKTMLLALFYLLF